MSCNSCSKAFSFLRSEKGCPGCGFSYCSKCLNYKIFLPKLNSKVMVCGKCKIGANSTEKVNIEPPAAYYKRIGAMDPLTGKNVDNKKADPIEHEIINRLQKLKQEKLDSVNSSDKDIAERLKKLKDIPSTSQAEVEQRLANIKGISIGDIQSKPILPAPDLRSDEEQANDLLKQYMGELSIDKKYKDNFEDKSDIEARLQKLKGSNTPDTTLNNSCPVVINDEESEDDIIRNIIETAKNETLDDDSSPSPAELPFCEICNEDAIMRCLGCKYLFCKHCFMEHRDEDDGCDKYEKYTAP